MNMRDWLQRIQNAKNRIDPWIIHTPLAPALELGEGNDQVFFKQETVQVTHSFKARGAFSKLTSLTREAQALGVVAASSGNHGAAVAYGAKALGTHAMVFVPNVADPSKVNRIRDLGAQVTQTGEDCIEAEAAARAYGELHGMTYISPYNDPDVIAGQGTMALEVLDAGPVPDAIIVAVGGGGLIGGIGAVFKSLHPATQVIAASPIESPALHEALKVGHAVEIPSLPTWSDATAGGIEEGAITIPLCQEVISESVLCSEEEIESACRDLLLVGHHLVEGAAGLAYAAYRKKAEALAGKRVVIILCGAAISHQRIQELVS